MSSATMEECFALARELRTERDRIRELRGTLVRFAQYIVERAPAVQDHACAECVPGGEIVIADFRCVRHEARALLDGDSCPAPASSEER